MGMMNKMVDAMEWLDKCIVWKEEGRSLEHLDSQIELCETFEKKIQIFRNIEILADRLGETELKERRYKMDGHMRVRKSFMYKGYEVYQVKVEQAGGTNA